MKNYNLHISTISNNINNLQTINGNTRMRRESHICDAPLTFISLKLKLSSTHKVKNEKKRKKRKLEKLIVYNRYPVFIETLYSAHGKLSNYLGNCFASMRPLTETILNIMINCCR